MDESWSVRVEAWDALVQEIIFREKQALIVLFIGLLAFFLELIPHLGHNSLIIEILVEGFFQAYITQSFSKHICVTAG